MTFDDVAEAFDALDFPLLNEAHHPDRNVVIGARAVIEKAIPDDDFVLDCIGRELLLIESRTPRWGLVPFTILPRTGIRFAFGYWPPGAAPPAHEHTSWTVTGVCRNELEVRTFDRPESYRRGELVDKNLFPASQGKVGFIYDAGIHQPRNPSSHWSLSLHVISPRDGRPLHDLGAPPPALTSNDGADEDSAYATVRLARQRQRWLRELASIVAAAGSRRSPALLADCFRLGTSKTRRYVERLGHDPRMTPGSRLGVPYRLERTETELALRHESRDGYASLCVETPAGPVEEFVVSDVAVEALSFAACRSQFDVAALPGLDDDERTALAEALEDTGLFQRVEA
jgi:hypothetical protein